MCFTRKRFEKGDVSFMYRNKIFEFNKDNDTSVYADEGSISLVGGGYVANVAEFTEDGLSYYSHHALGSRISGLVRFDDMREVPEKTTLEHATT